MKNLIKIITGLISLWIFADIFILLFFWILIFIKPDIDELVNQLIRIQKITAFLAIPLMIFYIAQIFKNSRMNKDKKILWSLAIFLAPTIATPIYWYYYIWQEPAFTDAVHIDPTNGTSSD